MELGTARIARMESRRTRAIQMGAISIAPAFGVPRETVVTFAKRIAICQMQTAATTR